MHDMKVHELTVLPSRDRKGADAHLKLCFVRDKQSHGRFAPLLDHVPNRVAHV